MDWTALLEAIGRLIVAIAGLDDVCPAAEDYAIELTDDINNYAYQLEHED